MSAGIPRPAFAALILATVLAVFDLSMVNLALPTIAADLRIAVVDALWLSKSNLLACALCILPCAALGDRFGHRQMLCAGLLLVAVTTLGCALSTQLPGFVVLRALQGAGSAAIMCSTLVLLKVICTPAVLGKAMGLNALFVAVTTTASPALSGLLLEWLDWRWLFLLTLPLALLALLLARATLPRAQRPASRLDIPGMLLLLALLPLLLAATGDSASRHWAIATALVGAAFVYRQARCGWALLPLSLFGNRRFDSALLASTLAFVGQSAVFISIPLLLQGLSGYGPLQTAWVFLLWPLSTAMVAPLAGHWADRRDARPIAEVGLLLLALGLAALASLPGAPLAWQVAWPMALCGVGFGLFQSPNNREILINVLPAHAARGAALLCLARLCGQALGAVLVSTQLTPAGTAAAPWPVAPLLWGAALLQVLSVLATRVAYRRAPSAAPAAASEPGQHP